MLILTRKRDESIVVGNVTITVVDIRGDKVRLGIEAPPHVAVHRREVYDALRRDSQPSPACPIAEPPPLLP